MDLNSSKGSLVDQYERDFFLKEYEPQEAKQSVFKRKKESFQMCTSYAYPVNEISSKAK